MRFTDIFIRRPVLAISISMLIAMLGLQAIFKMSIRQYPNVINTVVTVNTSYHGASAELIQGFITQPLEQAIAQANNINYISSTSMLGTSTITAQMNLNTNPDAALADILSKVNSVRSQLPKEAQDPIISLSTGAAAPIMYLSFTSKKLTSSQISDYLERVVKPKLFTINGISKITSQGAPDLALRIWLEPQKIAEFGLSTDEVMQALQNNNYQSAVGQINNEFILYNGSATTQVNTPVTLEKLVISSKNGQIIRLRDVAKVTLSKSSNNLRATSNGHEAVLYGINSRPKANPINIAADVIKILPDIKRNMPSTIKMKLVYNATTAINDSINDVIKTIFEASIVVLVVITLFIGSFRSVLIPVITIPLSLIGVALIMQLFGFTWNIMTLLALVLAIGLVVDDAIVVLENIERHIKLGQSPFRAAIIGTREIAVPVISMTITLGAVYAPIALMEGLTGSLFKEFALTLAGAVFISGIIALTLSPVMCAHFLRRIETPNKFELKVHSFLDHLTLRYEKMLARIMEIRAVVIVFAVFICLSLPVLFTFIPSELAPQEDEGVLLIAAQPPTNVNLDYMQNPASKINDIALKEKNVKYALIFSSSSGALGVVTLKPQNQRKQTLAEITSVINEKITNIPQVNAVVFPISSMPASGSGTPIQFVITSPNSFKALYQVATEMLTKIKNNPMFISPSLDLNFSSNNMKITIDQNKAGAYGVTMRDIGSTLSTMLTNSSINRVDILGRSYQVIPQVERKNRFNPSNLNRYYVKTSSGEQIPLGSLINITITSTVNTLHSFNQQNAVTISAGLAPGIPMGTAITWLNTEAIEVFPKGYSHDYLGSSRQYLSEGSALYQTFILALIIIYLVLAIQFESLRDPLVILVSVPLAICGALIALAWGATTLNIFSQVGLITLIGLITKHGILICEVAKKEQLFHGKNRIEAIMIATQVRLRPILMTTCAMIAGLIPLLYASGTGSISRFSIGIVIVAGLSIGTLFTLFVLPVIYTFLASVHKPLPIFDENEKS